MERGGCAAGVFRSRATTAEEDERKPGPSPRLQVQVPQPAYRSLLGAGHLRPHQLVRLGGLPRALVVWGTPVPGFPVELQNEVMPVGFAFAKPLRPLPGREVLDRTSGIQNIRRLNLEGVTRALREI